MAKQIKESNELSSDDLEILTGKAGNNDVPEWEAQFDNDKLEKSKDTPEYPPTMRFILNKTYSLKILKPPFNPEKDGKPLMRERTDKDGKKIKVKIWAMLVSVDEQITKTYYPDQLTLFKLASFRRKNNFNHTELIGKRIEVQKEQDGFFQGKPNFRYNTRFFVK